MVIFMRTRTSGSAYYAHWCEGCEQVHLVPDFYGSKIHWEFNGNYEKPTLNPSVLQGPGTSTICHYFIRDGSIQYCGDCYHELNNQTRPLLPIPEEELKWLVHS